jgi:hypothetical protein
MYQNTVEVFSMPVNLRDARAALANKLGGFYRGTVSLDPDATDSLGQRSILCSELYDADRGSKGYSNQFVWVGKYKNQNRVRENGYRALPFAVYSPPTSGTYTITFYGFGTSAPIAFGANAATVLIAIQAIDPGLASVDVTGTDPLIIHLPDIIDVEISAGTLLAQGGIGAIETNKAFTHALRYQDEFEIHAKMPVRDADGIQGLNTIINMALRRMWFIDRFPITPGHNAQGTQTFFGLSGYDWLTSAKQVNAIYNPAQWTIVGTLTPPGSSTYTITLTMFNTSYTTAPIAFNANAATVQAALLTATNNLPITVTGTSPMTITFTPTFYAEPLFSVSAGTIANVRTMITSPTRAGVQWKFQYDGESPYLDNYFGQEGYSFYIEAYRPAHSWIAPQLSYGTSGSIYQASNVGFVDDYDLAVVDQEDLTAISYYLACKQLSMSGPATETKYWSDEAERAGVVAAGIKIFDLPLNDKPRGGMFDFSGGWGSKGYWGRVGHW